MNRKQKKMLTRILITAAMLLALHFIPVAGLPQLALYLAAYLVIGYDILRKAGKGILNHQVFDENFLMTVATIGAFALAIYERNGDYNEAIAVMLFYQVGELFQSYAVGKSRRNISALMDIRPDYANMERNGKLERVDPDEVKIGSIIVVQPGEKVPLDGIVVDGHSSLNCQCALSGGKRAARRAGGRRDHQRLCESVGRSENTDDQGIWGVDSFQNSESRRESPVRGNRGRKTLSPNLQESILRRSALQP